MIKFVDYDSDKIISDMVKEFEAVLGTTLKPSDERYIFLSQLAQVNIGILAKINYAGNQNLLRYASGEMLDEIGYTWGVYRLAASKAVTTLKFTLSAVQGVDINIPKGTRATPDGSVYFSTDKAIVIPAGSLYGIVGATATEAGESYNGYVAGQIKYIVDNVQFLGSVENLTTTAGGTDAESDDSYRERIRLVPESFSTAGCEDGYKFYAQSASANVGDVEVYSPVNDESISEEERKAGAGQVFIYVLKSDGSIPSDDDEILNIVRNAVTAKDVRPLTDKVTVSPPTSREYSVVFEYYITSGDEINLIAIQEAVRAATAEYIKWQGAKIGRDINPDKLRNLALNAGASRINLITPSFTALSKTQVALNSGTLTAISNAEEVSTMPTASASIVGKYYKYTGTTSEDYTNSYYYKCIETAENVYGWEEQKALIVYKGLSE